MVFALTDLPGYTRFQGMFQQYSITYIKLQVIPSNNVNSNPAATIPMVYYAVDYDDNIIPTQDDMLLKQGVRSRMTMRPWSIKLRPRVLGMTYESTTTTAYSPRAFTWISTSDSSVPHYGVKMWFSAPSVDTIYRVHATYYLKFKGLSAGAST